ncbi:DUF1657 domain-containing protein [Virgibacillus soli]|uniref:DUF1657 domain-containing protein n=1 Tax=Paracerasibacillus soli TaxID=480284 RepID=A0ABU5CNU8_9BACI|nr:DUF1657 domain-containing protein [Virgibacillus soli]MDY0408033.1 DUF1657 domain-containing protein [Virgibacillus soli]
MTVGSQVRSCYASIKSIEATMDILANQTTNKETQKVLEQANKLIYDIKFDLDQQLTMLINEEPQYKK